ncbi:hypothetical protein AVEN_82923-1 [Araneus ventricosus]|uniref:Mos1 transposase HTH domain-containing protein n=1 Tax=Araneus ventricosus TaxID=182803 RepID=A0A4Y2CUT9_ARAVE|nr:hypothetical protein AVEN_82923-1 [Araneus ventricosus]
MHMNVITNYVKPMTCALPYRTVSRWVKAFRAGLNETVDGLSGSQSSNGVAHSEEMANVRTLRCCHQQTIPCQRYPTDFRYLAKGANFAGDYTEGM